MAKVSFTKLGLKTNQEVKCIDFNGQIIEVKQYLPVNDKLELISNVINSSADDNNFANPVKVGVFTTLEVLYTYTNINFTDKQKDDPTKLYDILISSGLAEEVIRAIPENEYHEILTGVMSSVEAVYAYKNSVMGIFETITADYSAMNLDANAIYSKLADPNSMELVKQVLAKLG